MDTAVWVALITSMTSLAVAGISLRAQHRTSRETREEERRSKAKIVLDSYRGPLLSASSELGDRIDNIRHRNFIAFTRPGSGRERDAKLTTLFRFAQYFGWREVLRTEVQLLRFENETDTQLVSALIGDIVWAFASDALDERRSMLWSEEQRAIGELMATSRNDGSSGSVGYATFVREYESKFMPWMDDICRDLLSATAPESDRLRLAQWALYGLVTQLDEECAHRDRPWLDRARDEIRASAAGTPSSRLEAHIVEHVARIGGG